MELAYVKLEVFVLTVTLTIVRGSEVGGEVDERLPCDLRFASPPGTAEMAQVQLPEKEAAYPEFDTFGKTMPAYAVYARHVRGLKLKNVRTSLLKPDARPATIFIDVEDVTPADFAAAPSANK